MEKKTRNKKNYDCLAYIERRIMSHKKRKLFTAINMTGIYNTKTIEINTKSTTNKNKNNSLNL